ncbi:MAG: hypothetical protein OXE46_10255 [Chloroflexi bacterium]|nr:hypothetical protein [Chloroflexota bacterium]
MTPFVRMQPNLPYREGVSDVGALFLGLFCLALGLTFFARVDAYQPLRSHGETTIGKWVDGFIEPRTGRFQVIYKFELDGKFYRGKQDIAPEDYGGDGQPVPVLYLPADPKLSRVLGGEAVLHSDALMLALSVLGILLSLQHIYAYYRDGASWLVFLWRQLRHVV